MSDNIAAQEGDDMANATVEERLTDLESRVKELEQKGDRIAHLMSTLGGKFKNAPGVMTQELAEWFEEVGRTLSSVKKGG